MFQYSPELQTQESSKTLNYYGRLTIAGGFIATVAGVFIINFPTSTKK